MMTKMDELKNISRTALITVEEITWTNTPTRKQISCASNLANRLRITMVTGTGNKNIAIGWQCRTKNAVFDKVACIPFQLVFLLLRPRQISGFVRYGYGDLLKTYRKVPT